MTIIEFLEARIAEDEALARQEDEDYADTTLLPTYDSYHQYNWNTARVLAECAAKRAIIEQHRVAQWFSVPEGCVTCREHAVPVQFPCSTVRALASVYADHPDYQQEWAL